MTTDRQLEILYHLAVNDEMNVQELSEVLDVSTSTVRRELTAMEESGLLVRTHGAARPPTPVRYDPPYEKRAAQQVAEKRLIALAARSLVSEGMVIGLMGGTTCTELARLLRPVEHITIVTNAVNAPLELMGLLDKRVVVTGGMLNYNSYELVGGQALQSLENIHLSLAFIGASGISAEYGISISDEPEASVARAFKAAADKAVVIADHTKIGKTTFARLCTLPEIDLLITDNGITAQQLKDLKEAGLNIMVAEHQN